MQTLLLLISIFAATSFVISIINFFTIRVVKDRSCTIEKSVSVLVPMRNEEANARALMETLLASTGLGDSEFIILNDGSTDGTAGILEGFKDKATIVEGISLPVGWLGKTYACQQLADRSRGDFLVFLDADVRVKPSAISSAISLMESLGWDFISPYPREHGRTLMMKLVQPLLQWSWLASVPLRIAERGRQESMVIANGQFFIVKRSAYEEISGHASVKSEILDDLSLARTLTRAGFKGGVAEGSEVVECTMYQTNSEMIAGYTKSLWKAFGGALGTTVTLLLLAATQILPLALLAFGVKSAVIPLALISLTHLLAALRVKANPINAIAHPVAGVLLIALIVESYRRRSRGQLQWRGRMV